MGKLWTVTKREYVERVRTPWFLIATVFGPVVFGALLIVPPLLTARVRGQASADAANVVILDATGLGLGRRVAFVLNGGLFGDTARTRGAPGTPSKTPPAQG